MRDIAIVTDSLACLPGELLSAHQIYLVPPNIYYNGSVFRDWLDITPAEAYVLLEKDPEGFSTSGPPPSEFVQSYRSVSREARSILCITLSSKVSTVYNAAVAAREMVSGELPNIPIEVVDSATVTGAEGFIVLAAARAVERGSDLAGAVSAAEEARDNVGLVFVLDTIRHAYRTGRVPKVATQLGALLSVKPLLTWENGTAHVMGMTRSKEKGVAQMLESVHKKVGKLPVRLAVHHAASLEEGEALAHRAQGEFNCIECWLTEVSPIMGYSMGKGALGLAFHADRSRAGVPGVLP